MFNVTFALTENKNRTESSKQNLAKMLRIKLHATISICLIKSEVVFHSARQNLSYICFQEFVSV